MARKYTQNELLDLQYIHSILDEADSGVAMPIRQRSELYETLYDLNNLHEAFRQVRKSSHYKSEVQSFWWNELRYTYLMSRDIENGKYKPDKVYKFTISERGKTRHIAANSCKDRVINTVIQQQVLEPMTSPKLIYDNGASRTGFGVSHTRERIKKHLHDAMLEYGPEATAAVFDLKNFFGSIPIPDLLVLYWLLLQDPDILMLLARQLLAHNETLVGMGIGSIISQNAGIYYPHRFDNYIKIVEGRKYYARYMDDFYVICKNKREAHEIVDKVKTYVEDSLGLTLSSKKTQVCKLTEGFKFLKSMYKVSETGKVYVRLDNDTFRREKRKIRRFKNTEMTEEDVYQSYKSWRGNVVRDKWNMPRVYSTDTVFAEEYPKLWKRLKEEGIDYDEDRRYSGKRYGRRNSRLRRRTVVAG